ncbi:PIN domain-containing protein [soil metagenome]
MIVCDASAFVDNLVGDAETGGAARRRLLDVRQLAVPSVFPAEVTSALRSLEARGDITSARADRASRSLHSTRAVRYAFGPLADRVWELRHNVTVYDAWYVALAERMDLVLVTADDRLASAPGAHCAIEVVAGG